MYEVLMELVETYLRRAGLEQIDIDRILESGTEVRTLATWLGRHVGPSLEEKLEDVPVEW